MDKETHSALETLFKRYNHLLYTIALQITPTELDAGQLLILTFKEALTEQVVENVNATSSVSLIKLVIKLAHEKFNDGCGPTNFKLKEFENTPLLHDIICEQLNVSQVGESRQLTKLQVQLKLREELMFFRKRHGEVMK